MVRQKRLLLSQRPRILAHDQSLLSSALSGLCPRCGAKTLFEAPAGIAHKCRACGLDFSEYERGSRLATLVTALVAILLIIAAFALDEFVSPPLWLQAMIWTPVTIAAVLGSLRLYKTALLYRQYEIACAKKGDEL